MFGQFVSPLEKLELCRDPRYIPLPPSPPPKVRLPNRKPEGWRSVTPRSTSIGRILSLHAQSQDLVNTETALLTRDVNVGEFHERTVSQESEKTLVEAERSKSLIDVVDATVRAHDEAEAMGDAAVSPLGREGGARLGSGVGIGLGRPPPSRSVSTAIRPASGRSGRRVSGAIQYALLPPELSTPPLSIPSQLSAGQSPISVPLKNIIPVLGEEIANAHPNNGTTGSDADVEGGNDDDEGAAGIREIYGLNGEIYDIIDEYNEANKSLSGDDSEDDITHEEIERPDWLPFLLSETQEKEDQYVEFVRQQLSALFPDFYDPEHFNLNHFRSSHAKEESIQDDLNDFGAGNEGALNGIEGEVDDFGITENRAEARIKGGMGGVRPSIEVVPTVRNEMKELREEIERLRGVVGGLAEGIKTANSPRVHHMCDEGDQHDLLKGNNSHIQVQVPEKTATAADGKKDMIFLPETETEKAEERLMENDTAVAGKSIADREMDEVEELLRGEVDIKDRELEDLLIRHKHQILNLIRSLDASLKQTSERATEGRQITDLLSNENLARLGSQLVSPS